MVIDGAAVRVSLVCFSRGDDESISEKRLDGRHLDESHADLTAMRGDSGVDLTGARRLDHSAGVAFMGDTKGGPFDIPEEQAREWLSEPANPNGRPKSDVLASWMNRMDVTRRPADKWIVDFGWNMVQEEAALCETPFQHAKERVYSMLHERTPCTQRACWKTVETQRCHWLSGHREIREVIVARSESASAAHRRIGRRNDPPARPERCPDASRCLQRTRYLRGWG